MAYAFLIFLLAAAISLGIASQIARRRSTNAFFDRPLKRQEWSTTFADATDGEIAHFLDLVRDVFALKDGQIQKLEPADKVRDLYYAMNPPKWILADNGELAFLHMFLSKRYAVDMNDLWAVSCDNLTFGEIFRATQSGDVTVPICPCCESRQPMRDFDVCKICGWENDPAQRGDPDSGGGTNVLSLREARHALKKRIAEHAEPN